MIDDLACDLQASLTELVVLAIDVVTGLSRTLNLAKGFRNVTSARPPKSLREAAVQGVENRVKRGTMSVDHILPKSLGGGDEEENLVTSCNRCNSMKGAKSAATIIELWAQRRLGENTRG